MSNKLWRKARDLVFMFNQEYLIDPDKAIEDLMDRISDQRAIVKHWVFDSINSKYPELNLKYD